MKSTFYSKEISYESFIEKIIPIPILYQQLSLAFEVSNIQFSERGTYLELKLHGKNGETDRQNNSSTKNSHKKATFILTPLLVSRKSVFLKFGTQQKPMRSPHNFHWSY